MAATLFAFKAVALLLGATLSAAASTWCVVRSDASEQVMQRALDYACSTGADCAPIQSSGLCYLPNTLPAHASYAINSYYQRKRTNDPTACSFAGAAAIATTDPSYGSCNYPSSPSNAGGTVSTPSGTTNPTSTPTLTEPLPPPGATTAPPLYGGGGGGGGGGLTPGMGSVVAESPLSNASLICLERSIFSIIYAIFLLLFLPNNDIDSYIY
ncbi:PLASMODESMATA CALLOSE-BINDING PROTEIN 3-like [Salvia splendens]|uniref:PLASMODESMATA CALLOSE-BINDING PROTEIN 3-like n=1 Tax=Salvia splendens TaxID=180675 RepID=UPI001C269CDB|nr:PLASMODESMATA CALLOSE-BINDING PROTEIN 3-like [Salvia splendens]